MGPGPGPGFSLQQINVSACKTGVCGRARNVRARRCRVREFPSWSIWQPSGHRVSSPVSRNSSQEILPTDGRTFTLYLWCDRDSEGYVTTSLQSQQFQQYVNVSETDTSIPVVIFRPKWIFFVAESENSLSISTSADSFAYKVKIWPHEQHTQLLECWIWFVKRFRSWGQDEDDQVSRADTNWHRSVLVFMDLF